MCGRSKIELSGNVVTRSYYSADTLLAALSALLLLVAVVVVVVSIVEQLN